MNKLKSKDPGRASDAIADPVGGKEARNVAEAPPTRGPRQPTKGQKSEAKPNLSAADLLAGCRKMIDASMGLPSAEVEVEARDRFREFEEEVAFGREVRDAAVALTQAIQGAEKVARRCRQSIYDDFSRIVDSFVVPFMKEQAKLENLSWRPQRESNSEITRFIEAIDRTNFLGLVNRPATDQEIACLLYILGHVVISPSQRKTSLRATLKPTVDAVHKSRWVELHGRPALIEKTKRELADLLSPKQAEWSRLHVKRVWRL